MNGEETSGPRPTSSSEPASRSRAWPAAPASRRTTRVPSGRCDRRSRRTRTSQGADRPGVAREHRHHFREGLALARRVRSLAPDMALAYGVMGDALVELGRFEAGYRAYERMAELKPSIAAYARVAQVQASLGESDSARRSITSHSTPRWMPRPGRGRMWSWDGSTGSTSGSQPPPDTSAKPLAISPGNPACTRGLGRDRGRPRKPEAGDLPSAAGGLQEFLAAVRGLLGDLCTLAGGRKAAAKLTTSCSGKRSSWPRTASTPTSTGRCSSSSTESTCAGRSGSHGALRAAAGHRGERGSFVGARPKRRVQRGGSLLEPGPPSTGTATSTAE